METTAEIKDFCSVQWLTDVLVEYKIKRQKEQITILINFGNEDVAYQNQEKQAIFSQYPKISLDAPIQEIQKQYTVPAKQVLILK